MAMSVRSSEWMEMMKEHARKWKAERDEREAERAQSEVERPQREAQREVERAQREVERAQSEAKWMERDESQHKLIMELLQARDTASTSSQPVPQITDVVNAVTGLPHTPSPKPELDQVKELDTVTTGTSVPKAFCEKLGKTRLHKSSNHYQSELFNDGQGRLKDFELEVKFKPDMQAVEEDLAKAKNARTTTEVWKPAQVNDYGTPGMAVRKSLLPGTTSTKLQLQLQAHRRQMPTPEDLNIKLDGGHGFIRIKQGPESQRRLALSTHKGVLLQTRLPIGITSASAGFQELMENLTHDLPGVVVYMDYIMCSGNNTADHMLNLRRLLERLNENGLRCRLHTCTFASAQPTVEYLGHLLPKNGIVKGPKIDAVRQMPPLKDAYALKTFQGSVKNQFDNAVEYRRTSHYGNTDALSRLPIGSDNDFDGEESGEDIDTVHANNVQISQQVKSVDSTALQNQSVNDPVISAVMRHIRKGFPGKKHRITHLAGDSYHPAMNGSVKFLVPIHVQKGKQAKDAIKSKLEGSVAEVTKTYDAGDPGYAQNFGSRPDRDVQWDPGIVTKRLGPRSLNVRVHPREPTRRHHLEQLHRRHQSPEDGTSSS